MKAYNKDKSREELSCSSTTNISSSSGLRVEGKTGRIGFHYHLKRQINGDIKAFHLAPLQALHLVAAMSPAQTLVIVQVPLSLLEGNTKPQREVKRGN